MYEAMPGKLNPAISPLNAKGCQTQIPSGHPLPGRASTLAREGPINPQDDGTKRSCLVMSRGRVVAEHRCNAKYKIRTKCIDLKIRSEGFGTSCHRRLGASAPALNSAAPAEHFCKAKICVSANPILSHTPSTPPKPSASRHLSLWIPACAAMTKVVQCIAPYKPNAPTFLITGQ